MLRPEPLDIVIILLVALLLFGANRLPDTARALGRGIREFKAAVTGSESDIPPRGVVPALAQKDRCEKCGAPVQPDMKFCPECGALQ